MFLRTYGSFKSEITTKIGSANRKLAKVSHLWKVRKYNKLFMSANLWIYDLRKLFADRPPLTRIKNNCVGNSRTWKSHSLYI
jgi:hypothetical protein